MKASSASTIVGFLIVLGAWLLWGYSRWDHSLRNSTFSRLAQAEKAPENSKAQRSPAPLEVWPNPEPLTDTPTSAKRAAAVVPSTTPIASTPPPRRPWNPEFFASLENANEHDPIQFELTGGTLASGTINRLKRSNGEVTSISGRLLQPRSGRFMFSRQSLPGVAGAMVGVVEISDLATAYRIEATGPDQELGFVERPLGEVVCLNLPQPERNLTAPESRSPDRSRGRKLENPSPPLHLESLPGAQAVIFLDPRGGSTETWGGITYEPANFSTQQMHEIWQRVAEDYLPFTINVTTDPEVYNKAALNSRQRVIITPTVTAAPGTGGAAYVGSFNWTEEAPCWVFVTLNAKDCAQACSHEAGHTLGLFHSGQFVNGINNEYYYGHGSGETGWAPLMGIPYYQNVTQWSHGEYTDANTSQLQLKIITSQNNVRHRADDAGDTFESSRILEIDTNGSAQVQGIIETSGDADAYRFTTTGGAMNLRAEPAALSPNLAINLALYDANDALLLLSRPQTTLGSELSTNLVKGSYSIRVIGAGRNNPKTSGFSDYGSLGYYNLSGSVENAVQPDRFTVPENSPKGTLVGIIPVENPNRAPLIFKIISGNTNNTFSLDNFGKLMVANPGSIDYETLASNGRPAQFQLFVDVLNTLDSSLDQNRRSVLVAVNDLNEAPVIKGVSGLALNFFGIGGFEFSTNINLGFTNFFNESYCFTSECEFDTSLQEHAPSGTSVAKILATDPDFFTLLSYSIVAGNSNQMFHIDPDSGQITLAGDPIAAAQNIYPLKVVVSDQTPPLPLMATSTINVKIKLPFSYGSIAYAVYTNIPGSLISDLTNNIRFPADPAFEEQATLLERTSNEEGPFGAVMRGYLLPPETGHYRFWIASQDNSELWLGTSTNPASMTRIAHITGDGLRVEPREWTRYASQESQLVLLSAGYAYYLEVRLKAGTAQNYIGVAWECTERGRSREVISGDYLAPFIMNYAPHPLGFAGILRRNAFAGSLVGTVNVSDVGEASPGSLAITAGNEAGLFSMDPLSGKIRLVDDALLRITDQSRFVLQVQVTDRGTPPLTGVGIATVDIVSGPAIVAQSLSQEIWNGIHGKSVSDLTADSRYPNRPDVIKKLTGFDSGLEGLIQVNTNGGIFQPQMSAFTDLTRFYGSRIRGYLTPTNSGLYTFFLASRGESQLMFGDVSDPLGIGMIAYVVDGATDYHEWTRYPSQQAKPKWLEAGRKYYIETLHKADDMVSGSIIIPLNRGHVAVAWTGPGLGGTNVISDSFLKPIDLEYSPTITGGTFILPMLATNGTVVATLQGLDSRADTLTYRIVDGNAGDTFGIDQNKGNLLVVDNRLIGSGAHTNFSLTVQVQDSGYEGLFPLRTVQTMLNVVVVDTTPPVTWTGIGASENWSSPENWKPGLPGESSKIIFEGTSRLTNRNDLLTAIGPITIKNSGFLITGNPLKLMGGLSNRGSNRWAINAILGAPQTFTNQFARLDVTGSLNNNGYNLTTLVAGTMCFDGSISGNGGLTKTGAGTLILSASNIYAGPTVINAGSLILTNSGSISASTRIDVGVGTAASSGVVLDVRGVGGGFTVFPGQTLGGSGLVLGATTIQGTLAPFWQPGRTDTLTFSNNLSLAGKALLQMQPVQRFNPSPSVGSLRVAGELTLGGQVIASNPIQTAYVNGDSYKLFNAGRVSGEFSSIKLPSLPNGLQWDASRIALDGTVHVTASPPNVIVSSPVRTGLTLKFHSASGVTYILESAPSLETGATWTKVGTYPGTGGTRTIPIQISPDLAQRYLRLRAQ